MENLLREFKAWKYRKYVRIVLSVALFCVCGIGLAACTEDSGELASTTSANQPAQTQLITYNSSEDAPFLPKDVFSDALFVPGVVLSQSERYCLQRTNRTDVGVFVIKGEYGKCYEIKIPAGVPCAVAAKFDTDPGTLAVGQQLTTKTAAQDFVENPTDEVRFMYNCREAKEAEFLVIYTGTTEPVYIGERTIIAQADTSDHWYIPESVGAISDEQRNWTSDEIVKKLYEPMRRSYPDYITRTSIGKDASGSYKMYCYVYTPENYETTIFLNGGTHGDEGVGYFALAKIMQLIADAKPQDAQLYALRQKVRFVVLPIVNVWSVSENHSRYNSNWQDINRDYKDLTQQESKNVMACVAQYADEIDVVMDFHIANACDKDVAVYFNFINYSDNAVANYKTTNHMYHRYKELGYAGEYSDLSKVPGSYKKGDQYFEGRIWNQYGIPTITVEYLTTANFPVQYSDQCMTLAVETYLNFIIQNSLFYLQGK